jgi:hypothetical protein
MSKKKKDQPEHPGPRKRGSIFHYAWDFTRHMLGDNNFTTRLNAITNGAEFVAQAVGGTLFFLSASLFLMPLGIAGCAAFAGIGLAGVAYGFPKAWQSMEGICARSFPKFNPPKRARLFLQKKFGSNPLVKKIVNSRFFKGGLSPRKQDLFLAALTIEGAAAAMVFCGIGFAGFIAALPVITPIAFLTVPMAITAFVLLTGPYDIFCGLKTVAQTYKSYRKEKKAKKAQAAAPAGAVAPPAQETTPAPAFTNATSAFNSAGTEKPVQSTAQASTPKAPVISAA